MNNLLMVLSRNKPGIMMGLGIGCMLDAIITGITYSPMARDAIEDKKKELEVEELGLVDTIKTAGPYFLPTITFAGAGIACIVHGNQINLERQAAAITTCAISEATSQIYREKVRDIVGEKKEKTIHEAAAKESYYKNDGNIILASNKTGDFRVYDSLTNQEIQSNIESIHRVENNLNRQMRDGDNTISLDEYCFAMNERPMEFGNEIGWHIDRGYIDMKFTAIIAENGEPCIVITHNLLPRSIR